MLRITRRANKVSIELIEDDRHVKGQRFTYPTTQEAMANAITARELHNDGKGYVAVANYLTYGVI